MTYHVDGEVIQPRESDNNFPTSVAQTHAEYASRSFINLQTLSEASTHAGRVLASSKSETILPRLPLHPRTCGQWPHMQLPRRVTQYLEILYYIDKMNFSTRKHFSTLLFYLRDKTCLVTLNLFKSVSHNHEYF